MFTNTHKSYLFKCSYTAVLRTRLCAIRVEIIFDLFRDIGQLPSSVLRARPRINFSYYTLPRYVSAYTYLRYDLWEDSLTITDTFFDGHPPRVRKQIRDSKIAAFLVSRYAIDGRSMEIISLKKKKNKRKIFAPIKYMEMYVPTYAANLYA